MSKPIFAVEIGDDPMLLLIAGVFVVTFITVCAVAYVLLAKRRTDGPATTWKFELQPHSTGVADNPVMMDDELTRLLAEGKTARARQVASERSRRGTTRRPSLVMLLLFLAVSVAVAGGVIYGVIYGMSFLGLRVLERLSPILEPIAARLAPSVLSPTGLVILGLLTLAIGLPCAPRFRRPARFRGGVIALALAFSTFWPLQFLAASFELPFPEWSVALHLLSGFISICLLTGGLEAIRMASNTPAADSWEFLK